MKVIFLDIDGVLVTRRPGVFEENLLRNLQRVVEETGSQIVLSSDWRRHPQARQEVARVLATVGLSFISCTPCMSPYLAQRPTEIMTWKRDFRKSGDPTVTHWVAIDDRELVHERHGSYLRGHFVQTHPLRGLTEDVADECIRMLNQELPPQESGDGGTSPEKPMAADAKRGASLGPGVGRRGGEEDESHSRTHAATHSAAAASALSAAVAARALQVHGGSTGAGGRGRGGARGRSMGPSVGARSR